MKLTKLQIFLLVIVSAFIGYRYINHAIRMKNKITNKPQFENVSFKHCKIILCSQKDSVVTLLDDYKYKCPMVGRFKVCITGNHHWELVE